MPKPMPIRRGASRSTLLTGALILWLSLAVPPSASAAAAETWTGTWNAPNLWRCVELTLRPGSASQSTLAVGTAREKADAVLKTLVVDDTSMTADLVYAGAMVHMQGRRTQDAIEGDLQVQRGGAVLTRGKWTLERRRPSDLTAERILENVRRALRFPGPLASGFTVEEVSTKAGQSPAWIARVGARGEIAVSSNGEPSLIFDGSRMVLNRGPMGWMPAEARMEEKTLLAEVVRSGAWMIDAPSWRRTAWITGQGDSSRYVVEISTQAGIVPAQVVIDPATWRPERAAVAWDAGPRDFHFSDYAEMSGALFPAKVTSGYRGREQTLATTRVIAGAGAFARPAPRGVSHDRTASPLLEGTHGADPTGHLFVRPTVAGRDVGWFHIDTGAPFIMLDKKVADDLGLEVVAEMGPRTVRRLPEIRVGQLVLRDQPVLVQDLSNFSSPDSTPRAGVIGGPVFEHAVVVYDYPGQRLSVFAPDAFRERVPDWQTLSVEGPPVIDASFDGTKKESFYIDTGKSGTVSFMSQAAVQHGLFEGRVLEESENETVEGTSLELVTHLKWFTLGGKRFENPEVRIKPPGTTNDEIGTVAGYVGRGFFGDRRVIFDYARERIAFLE